MGQTSPSYAVPALEKALDILELLADEAGGMTQSQVAEAVGRSVSEVFRVLTALERRRFIYRDPLSGLYWLSTRMFDLANRHAPLRGLVQLSLGPMRELASQVSQSCNLSILDADSVRVIAQAESPADFGYSVRVGAMFPVATTATGLVLVSGARDDIRQRFAEIASTEIASAGYLLQTDSLQAGITDAAIAITGMDGYTIAALSVPYIATTYSEADSNAVVKAARETAAIISARLSQ